MKKIYTVAILIAITLFVFADILEKDGKAGKTGSPGENDCTGCHTSFTVNSGPGSISISSPNLTNWQYVPGQVYQVDVTVTQPGVPLFGFGFEALRTSNNSNGGTLSITNSAETQLKNAFVSGNNRTNVVHKENGGLSTGTHTFSFNWTAPATNIGNIMFYTAGNAANNQDDSLNDYIYKTTQLVTPFVSGMPGATANDMGSVFPNPAYDELTLVSNNLKKISEIELIDQAGRVVYNKGFHQPVSDFNITGLSCKAGIYFLKFRIGDQTGCSKILFAGKKLR